MLVNFSVPINRGRPSPKGKESANMDAEKRFKSLILFILFFFPFCTSLVTLKPNQSIKGGQYLMSKEKNFAFGFLNPGNSSYRYLGIWYFKVTVKTVVWVANRNNPINGSSGVLSINQYGNLVLYDGSNHLLWTTNVSVQGTTSTVAQLQDSGNLVLVQDNNKNVLWQSFDYPTDTLLPVKGMKLGLNQRTGMHWFLTSWKSQDDPGAGDYVYKLDPDHSPQFFLDKGSTPLWRTSAWPWISSAAETTSPDVKTNFVYNQDEISYSYFLDDPSVIARVVVDSSGLFQLLMWNDGDHQWKELWSAPRYRCDKYGHCGKNSICSAEYDYSDRFECSCLPGYETKSPRDWSLRNGSEGCVRQQPGFVNVGCVKIPDSPDASQLDTSMSGEECEKGCLRNCSCMAFITLDIDRKGIGCWTWYGELVDITGYTNGGFDLNVRVNASELAKTTKKSEVSLGKKGERAIAVSSAAVALFLLSLLAYMCLMKKRKAKASLQENELGDGSGHPELLLFDLRCLVEATDNFSPTNKLGEGGFGSVFKGRFSNGQQIAVKRLSKSSGQGIGEFKTEVLLISKLQHRNLVKILGCCIQGEEKMLIYEYMLNKSLDFFIFDDTRSSSLNWSKRFEIIMGIARGVLYLHQDSRLRIIHRDLKTSNILLDAEMNPKISDFGVARIFDGDQIQDKTTRIVGTYGYMPPEYAVFGKFSTKTDVFSFGVILLEIVSGKKNNGSYQKHPSLTLIGHVWELWRGDRALDIADSTINESCVSHEVLRCIQVGLLCVQEDVMDRPTMSAVLLMLSSEAAALPSPKQPAFIFRRDSVEGGGLYSVNEVTITNVEAR